MEADDQKGAQKDQNEQVVIRKGRTALNKKPPFTQRTTHARVQLSEETSRKRGPRPPFKPLIFNLRVGSRKSTEPTHFAVRNELTITT
ncbi:hypothetical protein P4S73_27030 [Paraglaciecola sp. Hal342]